MPRNHLDLETVPNEELLRRAKAAVRVGESDEARTLLEELLARDPGNADAWLWRAGVETQPQRKREYFERVLALRPEDEEAHAGLAALAAKYGAGVLQPDSEELALRCTWHPERETLLRCNRCNRPMCTECAVQHPVGLRCKECVKELRPAMYSVSPRGYVAATLAGLAVGGVAGVLLLYFGAVPWFGWLLAAGWGGLVGGGVAEAVSRAAGRKRGRGMQGVGVAALVAGVALALLWRAGSPERLLATVTVYLFPILLYFFVAIGAVLTRLR